MASSIKSIDILRTVALPLYNIVAHPNIWGLDKIQKDGESKEPLGDFPKNITRVYRTVHVPCLRSRDQDYQGWRAAFQLRNGTFVFLEAAIDDFLCVAEAWKGKVKPNNYFDKTERLVCSEGAPLYGYTYHVPEIRLQTAKTYKELLDGVNFGSFDTPWDTICGGFYHSGLFERSGQKGGFTVTPADLETVLKEAREEAEERIAAWARARQRAEEARKAREAAAKAAAVTETASVMEFVKPSAQATKGCVNGKAKSKKAAAAERRAAMGLVQL